MSEQAVPDVAVLQQLIGTIATNTESLRELKDETASENKKRDKRIRWSRIVSVVAALVGVIGIAVGAIGINAAHTNQQAITASAANGIASRKSACDGFEAFTNALIGLSPPSTTDEARVAQQAKIDKFKADLEHRLAALQCHLHLLPGK